MKYLLMVAIVSVFAIGCKGEKQVPEMKHDQHAAAEMGKASTGAEKIIYYTCPMESHKNIHSSEPGTCSECNMTLVPGVITTAEKMEYYGCPMEIHSHVRHEAPGRCAECKMELKPMRLKKTSEI
ncbi:MAG: hypothetical protein HOD43_05730 [Candidatus Marinimicrobia bacterium]|jgi:hypothetical protein|nr:hypothetical protein [Candidatus Neomarinimicrobiota bacterium]MBT3632519.1 hypothetical protein [Candidatus Neomarinimicrobiota bacterium]MBT3824918.1 hypothetical protein [Candidatus Neomarinimicrobiota bacterium]MBT4132787.1 hypothetical protein [Candidatus Neomarinimicrobiota bacterium]MBT4295291.1 hypothetical protein [Candidatus Neomarinimicrobiota bacterium]